MRPIGEIDLLDRLAPAVPPLVTQIGFAILCSAIAIGFRVLTDLFAPAAGPFALVYPAALLATLFGRGLCGLLTSAISLVYAWYYVLPDPGSFVMAQPADGPRLLVNAVACAVIVAVAASFRRLVREATLERDRQIADRDLFLEEFDHRVKNNFAIVASLLEMQRRRADPPTAEALGIALARIESIARAHRHLYRGSQQPGAVQMSDYLNELCAALRTALMLDAQIALRCHADPAAMPRDRAVSIGLVVNELVTNAAKHAFAGRDRGMIDVRFVACPSGWRLTVTDDGIGIPPTPKPRASDGGLGTRLIDAFARQAGGTITTRSSDEGTTITFDIVA